MPRATPFLKAANGTSGVHKRRRCRPELELDSVDDDAPQTNERQRRFVEPCVGECAGSATQAAPRAGYGNGDEKERFGAALKPALHVDALVLEGV